MMRLGWMKPVVLSATALGSACGEGEGSGDPASDPQAALDHHGDVQVQMLRAPYEDASPYGGTEIVEITLGYLECLADFYETEPEWRQDGPLGGPVFEAWVDRPCDSPGLECTIDSIEQNLEVSPPSLTVRYRVVGDVENRELPFGPLPDDELAGCQPIVRLGRPDAVRGEGASGDLLWTLVSFNPDTAETGQGQAISVRAGVP